MKRRFTVYPWPTSVSLKCILFQAFSCEDDRISAIGSQLQNLRALTTALYLNKDALPAPPQVEEIHHSIVEPPQHRGLMWAVRHSWRIPQRLINTPKQEKQE
jgi:hypothetical protein